MAGKLSIPTPNEIATLPRWVKVAFAARCARRIQMLFRVVCPDAPIEEIKAIERAISTAEKPPKIYAESAKAANVVYSISEKYHEKEWSTRSRFKTIYLDEIDSAYIITAAINGIVSGIADAAARAAHSAYDPNQVEDAINVVESVIIGINKFDIENLPSVKIISGIRRDFELIYEASNSGNWTNDTQVAPDFFGPLWTEGEEPDWSKTIGVLKYVKKKEKTIELRRRALETPISQFDFSARMRKLLEKMKIQTLGDLLNISEAELLAYKGFGVQSLKKLKLIIESSGFRIGEGLEEKQLHLQISVGEFIQEDDVFECVVDLYRALNEYHILCGGRGLTIDDWQVFVREDETVEVM